MGEASGKKQRPAQLPRDGEELPQGLWAKMHYVMSHSGHLAKTGYNKDQKYNYVEEATVVDHLRSLFTALGLIMTHSAKSCIQQERLGRNGPTKDICLLEVEFTIRDVETGEHYSFTEFAYGQDSLDKAPYKALTGANKYALMKTFMIPTGDDPERDNPDERPDRQPNNRKASSPPPRDEPVQRQEKAEDPLNKPANLKTVAKARELAEHPLLNRSDAVSALEYLEKPRSERKVLELMGRLNDKIAVAEAEEEEEFRNSTKGK